MSLLRSVKVENVVSWRRRKDKISNSLEHSEMLERLLDGDPFFRRAAFKTRGSLPIRRNLNWQTTKLFAMGDPAGFRGETELLLHPPLNFKISGTRMHEGRLSCACFAGNAGAVGERL